MRTLSIGLGVIAAVAALSAGPASAQNFSPSSGWSPPALHSQGGDMVRGDRRDGWRGDGHRRWRDRRGALVVRNYTGGEWALYNNRSWESDSYNDWWHDRPARAFPRWMRHNRNCERMYWSGGGWTC
jgi:hypothetical protein